MESRRQLWGSCQRKPCSHNNGPNETRIFSTKWNVSLGWYVGPGGSHPCRTPIQKSIQPKGQMWSQKSVHVGSMMQGVLDILVGPRWLGWWWIFFWWEYVVWQFGIMMMRGFFWMSCDKTRFILSRYLYVLCMCILYVYISFIFDIYMYLFIFYLDTAHMALHLRRHKKSWLNFQDFAPSSPQREDDLFFRRYIALRLMSCVFLYAFIIFCVCT